MKKTLFIAFTMLLFAGMFAEGYTKHDFSDLGIKVEIPSTWSKESSSGYDVYYTNDNYLDFYIYKRKLDGNSSKKDFSSFTDEEMDDWVGKIVDNAYISADEYYDLEIYYDDVAAIDNKKAVNVDYTAYLWEDYYYDEFLPTCYYENIYEVLYKGYIYGFVFYLEEDIEPTEDEYNEIDYILESIKIK